MKNSYKSTQKKKWTKDMNFQLPEAIGQETFEKMFV